MSVRLGHGLRPGWLRAALVVLLVAALVSSFIFGARTYRSLVLLHSAQSLGVAETSTIRAWMTLGYVAETYGASREALLAQLQLPPSTSPQVTLRDLSERRGVRPFDYVQMVQAAIAAITDHRHEAVAADSDGWLAGVREWILSAVLLYGYPALGLTLFLGAIGLPVPTGLSTTVAGSLASQGYLSWALAGGLAIVASILGDLVGYGIGRGLNEGFIERRGRWIGYTPRNRARAEALFASWGAITIVLTRTLVSHLSSVVSLLAGLSRYRLASFVLFAALGRTVWTAAYFGLGYTVGSDFEAASTFLTQLSFFLISVAAGIGASIGLMRLSPQNAS